MRPDRLGFLYPAVDREKCIDCGRCEAVCAFNDHYDTSLNLPIPDVYGARHRDAQEVATSQSGAAFIAISDWILRQGGTVYGAGYKDHFHVAHKRAETAAERDEFKGSKYVQSDIRGVFRQVREDLKDGKPVLFTGTPCQVNGLKSYLSSGLRAKLYTVDNVCHGVPGPFAWRDYLAYAEKKLGGTACRVSFRDKSRYGWRATIGMVEVEGGKKADKKLGSVYSRIFYRHVTRRYSCGMCPFTNTTRPSDITIGDFWGLEKVRPDLNKDDKGVSLVLVNTEKGRGLFAAVKSDLNCFPVALKDALQPNLCKRVAQSPIREAFEEDYALHGLEHALRKFSLIGWRYEVKQFLMRGRRKLGRVVRKVLPRR